MGLWAVSLSLLNGCGKDQRSLDDGRRGPGDERGTGGDASDDDQPREFEVSEQRHELLVMEREASGSCSVEVDDTIVALSGLGEGAYVTWTELPVTAGETSMVKRLQGEWFSVGTCEAHAWEGKVLFVWERVGRQRELVATLVDREGNILEEEGAEAEEFGPSEVRAYRGETVGQLTLPWQFLEEVRFGLLADGEGQLLEPSPIARCDGSEWGAHLVATEAGFVGAFMCDDLSVDEERSELVVFFVSGEQMDVHRYELPQGTVARRVALWPHWDGRAFVAYGSGGSDGEPATHAELLTAIPSPGFGYEPPPSIGDSTPGIDHDWTIELPNEGLSYSAHFEGLALVGTTERQREDSLPTVTNHFCYLDQTAIPVDACGSFEGAGWTPGRSGFHSVAPHQYAPVVRERPWDAESESEAVLFDVGLDRPTRLHCEGGDCEILLESFSRYGGGYRGVSFLDYPDFLDWGRDPVRSSSGRFEGSNGSILGDYSSFAPAWNGGDAYSLEFWDTVGPLVLRFGRGEFEVVSYDPDLAFAEWGPFALSDGLVVLGEKDGERLMGHVRADGTLDFVPVDTAPWGEVIQCGDWIVNQAESGTLHVGGGLTSGLGFRELEFLDEGEPFTMVGCTGEFLLRRVLDSGDPMQLVDLSTGATTPLDWSFTTTAQQATVVGDRLGLFFVDWAQQAFGVALVDRDGQTERVRLPIPDSWTDDFAQLVASGLGAPLAPREMSPDMSHMAVVWGFTPPGTSRVDWVLSSWQGEWQ